MNLFHRVGAGLILLGGLLPVQADAGWPLFGGNCCGAPPPVSTCGPIAPMAYPAAPCCGSQPHFGRLPRQRQRQSVVYRSRTRIRMHGSGMMGDSGFGGAPMLGAPMGGCGCGASAAPMMMPEQMPMMVPQTSMCPQQMMTYQNVPKTVMRQEAVQVQVPTTTYQQVSVDEGNFQQVWVPRLVTKNVPQTVMTTQVQYRQIPQTVFERVPQITTMNTAPIMGSSCGTCGSSYALGGQSFPIATPTTVTPVQDYNPAAPLNPVPQPTGDTATAPQTAPQTSQIQEYQKVRQRSPTIQQQAYEYESKDEGYLVPKAAGRFSSKR